jgi:hypothetical protein
MSFIVARTRGLIEGRSFIIPNRMCVETRQNIYTEYINNICLEYNRVGNFGTPDGRKRKRCGCNRISRLINQFVVLYPFTNHIPCSLNF